MEVGKGQKPPSKPKQPTSIAPAGCAQQWGRFVICSLKVGAPRGNSPALSIPDSLRDRSPHWRHEGDLAAEAGRAAPGYPPALGGLGAVPWESWANHSRCGAKRERERENSGEALCRGLLALAGQIPSIENIEPQSRPRPLPCACPPGSVQRHVPHRNSVSPEGC